MIHCRVYIQKNDGGRIHSFENPGKKNKARICGQRINGLTGLMELHNLHKHLRRAHGFAFLDTNRLLEIRAAWEKARE